jgi:predicted negative regulator of RcsB-dependent stress response
MTKRLLILSVFSLFIFSSAFAQQESVAGLFEEANNLLAKKKEIVENKMQKIAKERKALGLIKESDLLGQCNSLIKLSKEYEYFVYDSAFYYGNKALKLAYAIKDKGKVAEAKANLSLVMLLKGMYKETIDSISSVDIQSLSNDKRIEFYAIAYRAYYDLANSRWGYYAPKYRRIGDSYCEKIFQEGKPDSYNYVLAKALKSLNNAQDEKAISHYHQLIDQFELTYHQQAITHSGVAMAYLRTGEVQKAKYHLLKAVIGDIQSATMETLAAKSLAEILFHEGDLQKANKYITEAQKDANFYGSNARRLQIAFIQPKIEAAVLNEVEKEKSRMFLIGIVITILLVIIVVFAIIFFRQLQELKRARKEILESNKNLRTVNDSLREVSQIKEEYVGYYFNFSSQFIEKMDGMKKAIARQLMTKQYDAIDLELKKYNPKKERKYLFEDFDRIFLKLFPDFVNRFNQLFDEADQIALKDSQSLNTDLRIFALIRLGVNDNEKIASILNFSVNTIYTYKTRIKNKSMVTNEEFESKIMEIKSV